MKRRTVVLKGTALFASTIAAMSLPRRVDAQAVSNRIYDWPISDLRSGGTVGLPAAAPVAAFQAGPKCEVTLNKILGPCHTNDVPLRRDVTEGVSGLPMWVSLRIVEATTCKPIENADVEIWHADVRGVYSGRAADMCNQATTRQKAPAIYGGDKLAIPTAS